MILLVSIGLLFSSASLSILLAYYLRSRADNSRSGRLMAWLMVATAWWALFNGLELVAPDLWTKFALANIQYIAIAGLPVLWFRFGTRLRKRDDHSYARLWQWDSLIWLIPLATACLVWTDPWLGLVRFNFRLDYSTGFATLAKNFGPWFWLHSAFSYVLILAGTVSIIVALDRRSHSGRRQAWILAGAALVPALSNVAYLARWWPLTAVDPTPIAFTITGLLFVFNLSRFRFLALMPAAQNAAMEGLKEGVLILDAKDKLVFLNAAVSRFFGINRLDAGMTLAEIGHNFPFIRDLPTQACTGDESTTKDIEVYSDQESRIYQVRLAKVMKNNQEIASVYTFHDITRQARAKQELELQIAVRTQELSETNGMLVAELERRQKSEKQLTFFSLHDPLTGLSNRSLLIDRLGLVIERLRRDPTMLFAVLYIDFDNFKLVNDSYGHSAGDAFLREAARRIQFSVRMVDTVARLGGDEFVVLLDRVNNANEALEVADRIADELSVPIRHGANTIIPSASVGVLPATDTYLNPEDLLRDADLAMYAAKNAGKNKRILFDESMRMAARERTQITNDLSRAILNNELELNYQPIVRLSDGALVGCEALVRWNHPELGRISPDRFIPLAEESGLIIPLGLHVLIEACKTAATMAERSGAGQHFIAVNISALQVAQANFADILVSSLERFGLDPAAIHLELTESALVEHAETVQPLLHGLKRQGFHFKLDDFGTGYSSLAYLHRFPIDTIKIDRSFVMGLDQDHSNDSGDQTAGILKGIISLGHELGKDIVAEGIETVSQLEILKSWGCDYGQGYLFSKPVSLSEWLRILEASTVGVIEKSGI